MPSLVDPLRSFFESRDDGLLAAYLFGSVARGTAREGSDVDIAILLDRDPPRTLDGLALRLEGDLERFLGRRVQVVVLNRSPVDLIHRVLRDGQILLDRGRSARLRFEVRARAEYLDLLPFLRRYRRSGDAA